MLNQHYKKRTKCIVGGLAEWSKAADLRSVGQCPREFEPRILHFFEILFLVQKEVSFYFL